VTAETMEWVVGALHRGHGLRDVHKRDRLEDELHELADQAQELIAVHMGAMCVLLENIGWPDEYRDKARDSAFSALLEADSPRVSFEAFMAKLEEANNVLQGEDR
jgi:hypothetical protein